MFDLAKQYARDKTEENKQQVIEAKKCYSKCKKLLIKQFNKTLYEVVEINDVIYIYIYPYILKRYSNKDILRDGS